MIGLLAVRRRFCQLRIYAFMKKLALAAALVALSLPAAADDSASAIEWRALGPAMAWHSNTRAAPVTSINWDSANIFRCFLPIEGGPAVSPVGAPTCPHAAPLPVQSVPADDGNFWYVAPDGRQGSCLQSQTFDPAQMKNVGLGGSCLLAELQKRRRWSSNNPALGIEVKRRASGYADTALLTLVRDSYGAPSLLGAAGRLWTVARPLGIRLEVGATAALWWRQVDNNGRRRVVPLVLPALVLGGDRLGLNVSAIPPVRGGTGVVMLQLSYRL